MRVVSLFSGCGGLDLGFALAGHRVVYANDIDKTACASLRKNFGRSLEIDSRDISEVDDFPEADIVIGGYPCQGFSVAGNRDVDDKRNQLYLEFARCVKEVQPSFFLAENVKGLVSMAKGELFQRMLKKFSLLGKGYRIIPQVLNAKDYGVPQERERVFIVGIRKDVKINFQFPDRIVGPAVQKLTTLRQAIGDLPVPDLWEYNRDRFSYIYMSRNRKKEWNDVSFTIQANGNHVPLHPSSGPMVPIGKDRCKFVSGKKYRRLSYRECARIQSMPDQFEFEGNLADKYRQIGNAVPPLLAFHMARKFPLTKKGTRWDFSKAEIDFSNIIRFDLNEIRANH